MLKYYSEIKGQSSVASQLSQLLDLKIRSFLKASFVGFKNLSCTAPILINRGES